jgi:E3 ubiquitin-protein ligase DOA10
MTGTMSVVYDPELSNTEVCTICMHRESDVKLPCRHDTFCIKCIKKWKSASTCSTCPLCRVEFKFVWTRNVKYKQMSPKEEVFGFVRSLVTRHVKDTSQHERLILTINAIVHQYDLGKVLQLYDMYAGQVELHLRTKSVTQLLHLYYKNKHALSIWAVS